MADVEIKYNNSTIVSLSDSGTEVLETSGTFLTDDITIDYAKSGGGGGVVTRRVTFQNNDADAMYYTDATMTPQSITSGSKDINAELPVGSLVVYARTGISPPMPFPVPSTTDGVHQIASYSVGNYGNVTIYEVLPE